MLHPSNKQHKACVTAIIPARGGSKGIPQKNIRSLGPKPLIAYSIEAALKAQRVDRVIVSTDDEHIANISRQFGAEVPFLRPAELAKDGSLIDQAIAHVKSELWERERTFVAHTLVLYPSHPFRTPALLDEVVEKLMLGHSPICTVKRITVHPTTHLSKHNGFLVPLMQKRDAETAKGTQLTFFRRYGLVNAHTTGANNKPYNYEVSNPISLIDIDTPEDLEFARAIVANGLFDFEKQADTCSKKTHNVAERTLNISALP